MENPVRILDNKEDLAQCADQLEGPLETAVITGDAIQTKWDEVAYGHTLEKVKEKARGLGCNVVCIKGIFYERRGFWEDKAIATIEADFYKTRS